MESRSLKSKAATAIRRLRATKVDRHTKTCRWWVDDADDACTCGGLGIVALRDVETVLDALDSRTLELESNLLAKVYRAWRSKSLAGFDQWIERQVERRKNAHSRRSTR